MFLFNLICSFAPHFLVCSSQDQRQQYCLASKILLPPPKTRRNSPRPKAAILSHKQDFAASAEDPMKLTKVKGSKLASEARFCCLRRKPNETRQDQRQQASFRSKILLPSPKTRRNSPGPKAATMPSEAGFCCSPTIPGANQKSRRTAPAITRLLY